MNINMSLMKDFEELYDNYVWTKPQLLEIEGIAPKDLDVGLANFDFFDKKLSDISSDSNANWTEEMSPTIYRTFTTNGQMKLLGYHQLWYYTMKRFGLEFANKAISMIWNGDLYFHDAHGVRIQLPYCYAFSLDKIVLEGRPYGPSKNTPPKNRKSFLSQVDKFIGDLSKQFAGATAPSDFFLWYAYFCKQEGLELSNPVHKKMIIQDFQGMVCLMNDESRAEGEPPFTNISTYDMIGLESLFGHIMYPDWSKPDLEYIMSLQELFCEWFSNGDPITGFPYRFPVVTRNLTTDDNNNFIDVECAKRVARDNLKMANFNLHFGKKNKLAMCCRYENDLDDMEVTPDSFGNGGVNIGSHRVVTPNYGRAALLAKEDHTKFLEILDEYFEVSAKLLYVHRVDILEKRIKKNPQYLKFFGSLGWFNLNTMFSTFGLEGIYEAVKFMGYDILEENGTDFALDIMTYIRSQVKKYRNEYGFTFNAEEIPGEQACITLLKKDHVFIDHKDITYDAFKALSDVELYSNQYIPLVNRADIVTRLDLSGRFMKMISGGGIVHANVESPIDTVGKMYEIMKLAAKSGVPHLAVCYRFGKCANHPATVIGQNTKVCPICGDPIVHTRARVIGYFSDEYNWSPVRQIHDAPHRYYSSQEEVDKI